MEARNFEIHSTKFERHDTDFSKHDMRDIKKRKKHGKPDRNKVSVQEYKQEER